MGDYRTIYTTVNDPKSKAVMLGVMGQLSDGIWENSGAMNRYWMFLDVNDDCNLEVSTSYYGSYGRSSVSNALHDKSDEEVLNWFADKVKAVCKEWLSDNGGCGKGWSRDNSEDKVNYFDGINGEWGNFPSIRDAYRVYDALKGRIERIPYEAKLKAKRAALKRAMRKKAADNYTVINATREDADYLYGQSALTWEGMSAAPSNLDAIYAAFQENGSCPKEGLRFYVISGKDMDEWYGLTGDNAYEDDITILCIPLDDFEHSMALTYWRFDNGGRWFDDVVDNNARRERER